MGNKTSKLDLSDIFEHDIVPFDKHSSEWNKSYVIKTTTKYAVKDDIREIYINVGQQLTITFDKQSMDVIEQIEWQPDSEMIDFEVLEPFTPREVKLAKGQVIGTILVEPFGSYIKLYYDTSKNNGVHVAYSMWDHSDSAKQILNNDLTLGLEVLVIRHDKHFILREPRDDEEVDQLAGKVFVSGLDKSLEKYRHVDDESENEDEED